MLGHSDGSDNNNNNNSNNNSNSNINPFSAAIYLLFITFFNNWWINRGLKLLTSLQCPPKLRGNNLAAKVGGLSCIFFKYFKAKETSSEKNFIAYI